MPHRQLAEWLGRNWARFSYARHVEPIWLERTETHIGVADWPAAFGELRIVQLSDLHCGNQIPASYFEEVLTATREATPDLIALTGDFIHKGFRHLDQVRQLVSRMQAPLGVYAVLGNHDFSVRNALGWRRHPKLHLAVSEALSTAGATVLRNAHVPIQRNGESIYLCGLDDLWSRECDPEKGLAGLPSNVPCVVLAHNPQTIHLLKMHRCDLMLSGHTHGGQIDWPGLGRITLGRNARRFAAGLYREDGHWLYVSRGVGFGLRFRFRVRPEVALLTLSGIE